MDSVLVVDDDPAVREIVARWVEASGYAAKQAESADRALDEMSMDPAAVVLCDIRMPGHDGIWLADQLRERFPEASVIMLTGVHELDTAVASLRVGVVDYLLKPFDPAQLAEALERGVARHRASVEARGRREKLDAALRERSAALAATLGEMEVASRAALEGMLAMLTVRDRYAYEHAQRVARLSVSLALALGISEPQLSEIEAGALLHDVGKIAVPEALLHKEKLLDEEMAVMRQHPRVSYEVLKRVPFLAHAAELVLSSHEWYDGTGYPQRLQGAAIPIGSRIIAVADAYDAMTHPRLYRDAMPPAEAVREISRKRDSQFDPQVVDAFLLVLGVAKQGVVTSDSP